MVSQVCISAFSIQQALSEAGFRADIAIEIVYVYDPMEKN